MASSTNPSTTSPNWNGWPFWFPNVERAPALVPNKLDQQINPGWTFGNLISVTEQNSSSPDTERAIVAAHSYGRQLGRVMDAVAALIDALPDTKQENPAFKQFTDLRSKIEQIKTRSAVHRLDHFVADLTELRNSDEPEYKRVVGELRAILDA